MKAYIIVGFVVLSSLFFLWFYNLFNHCFEPFDYEFKGEQLATFELRNSYLYEFAKDYKLSFILVLLGDEEVSGKLSFTGRLLHLENSFIRKLFSGHYGEFYFFVDFNGSKGLIDRKSANDIGIVFVNGLKWKVRIYPK